MISLGELITRLINVAIYEGDEIPVYLDEETFGGACDQPIVGKVTTADETEGRLMDLPKRVRLR